MRDKRSGVMNYPYSQPWLLFCSAATKKWKGIEMLI